MSVCSCFRLGFRFDPSLPPWYGLGCKKPLKKAHDDQYTSFSISIFRAGFRTNTREVD